MLQNPVSQITLRYGQLKGVWDRNYAMYWVTEHWHNSALSRTKSQDDINNTAIPLIMYTMATMYATWLTTIACIDFL